MRAALGLLLASSLLLGCGAAQEDSAGASTRHRPAGPVITGYALAGSATPASITRDGDLVDVVGVDGVNLVDERSVGPVDPEATRLRDAAHHARRTAVLLFANFNEDLGDFDEPRAHALLSTPAHRAAVVRDLVRRADGFDGVQIDLESLQARDRPGLTAFTCELRAALPKGSTLSMAFMASGSRAGYARAGYDLPALGKVLDTAVLMSYDQHGPWSESGPIAAMPWVRRELATFVSLVPRHKVDLGAAAYGYSWGSKDTQLSVAQAKKVAGTHARWVAADGEWTAVRPGGRRLWWDDARSVELRRKLAAAQHLHGLAIWELGSSGPLKSW